MLFLSRDLKKKHAKRFLVRPELVAVNFKYLSSCLKEVVYRCRAQSPPLFPISSHPSGVYDNSKEVKFLILIILFFTTSYSGVHANASLTMYFVGSPHTFLTPAPSFVVSSVCRLCPVPQTPLFQHNQSYFVLSAGCSFF